MAKNKGKKKAEKAAKKDAKKEKKAIKAAQVANRPAHLQNIAKYGTETSGTNIGQVREVVGTDIDQTASNETRARQVKLADELAAAASGKSPSIAELQLKRGLESSISQQAGMIGSQSGISPGLATKLALNAGSALTNQTNAEAAVQRLAEAFQARQQLAGLLGQTRDSDIALASQQAGLRQQANLSNQSSFNQRLLSQAEINEAIRRAEIDAGARMGSAGIAAGASRYGADLNFISNQQNALGNEGGDAANDAGNANTPSPGPNTSVGQDLNNIGGTITGVANSMNNNNGGGGGGTTQTSDERKKENIKPADGKMKAFLDALESSGFTYKPDAKDKGKTFGVMAQDLEKSEVGDTIVEDTKDGKVIDWKKGLSAVLAAQAALNKRMKAVEGRA